MNTTQTELATLVAAQKFFHELAPQHVNVLAEAAMLRDFAPGELIFREGDPANRFYLILDGEVALESTTKEGSPILLQTLGAQDVLGWSWLFPPYYWHFDARALQPTKAIFFYGTWLRDSCERDHDFGYEMIKRVAAVTIARLQATRKKLAELERK